MLLELFRLPNYDTIGQPLNFIFSSQDSLEEGLTRATAEEQGNAGLRRVYHNLNNLHIMGIALLLPNGVLERIHLEHKILMNILIHYYNILILIKIQCLV